MHAGRTNFLGFVRHLVIWADLLHTLLADEIWEISNKDKYMKIECLHSYLTPMNHFNSVFESEEIFISDEENWTVAIENNTKKLEVISNSFADNSWWSESVLSLARGF